jgi:hypothetical protein
MIPTPFHRVVRALRLQEEAKMREEIGLPAENRRLKNLVAAAGEYFIKRQRGDGDDKVFEKAFLDTALPVMVKLEQENAAKQRDEDQAACSTT